jgi:hypothetical protein
MFTDASALIRFNPPQLSYGVAVTDVDGDGDFEIFVAGFGFANRVLKWNGRALTDIADETLADSERQAIGVAAADINGDGREEIYVLNTDTFDGAKRFGDRLFLNRGARWVDLFSLDQNQLSVNLTAGRSVACVDRNGQGSYGFFVANYGGPMRLYELGPRGLVEDVASRVGVDLIAGGRSLVSLPLVTSRMDVFAGNERGPNFLFMNKGDGTFTEVAESFGLTDSLENVRGITVLDANGDGSFDLVYGNWEGPHRMFVRLDGGAFRNFAPPEMALPSRVRTVIAADFDNDGYEELFFNNMGEPNRLFGYRDGRWQRLNIGAAVEAYGLGTGAVVGDFNHDGRLELLIAHGESGLQPLTLYAPHPNLSHWLRVLPLTRHGAPARGAVVRLHSRNRAQVRAIDAGSGYLCQMEPVAHFGLGPEPDDELAVEVYWPDGAHTLLDIAQIDRQYTVNYPN